MKTSLFIVCILTTIVASGQDIYKTSNGKVRFYSEAPLGNIEATTTKATAIMNGSSGEVAVLMPITSFEFAKSLMKEHFNEEYMESDKYKDASFKGTIRDKLLLTPGESSTVNVSGELLIHGVTQHRDIKVVLKVNADGTVLATGKFDVRVADHEVKIPTIVFHNIAEVVEVTFELTLQSVRQ